MFIVNVWKLLIIRTYFCARARTPTQKYIYIYTHTQRDYFIVEYDIPSTVYNTYFSDNEVEFCFSNFSNQSSDNLSASTLCSLLRNKNVRQLIRTSSTGKSYLTDISKAVWSLSFSLHLRHKLLFTILEIIAKFCIK